MRRVPLVVALLALASTLLQPAPAHAATGEWLAGDLHVHTRYSHDAFCLPEDDNTGIEEAYTLSAPPEERFLEASLRGLDFLAITDHNDVRSQSDPGFGSHGVIGLPGYENSLNGHAQMLGADHVYDSGDHSAAAVNAMAAQLRTDGGALQINHPGGELVPLTDCNDTSMLDWQYGYDVVPDTVEIWNVSYAFQPPLPSATDNDTSQKYWECWLNRGERVGATGGSDSHWLLLSIPLGPGNPTTWVFSSDRTPAGILQGLREGRTSISLLPALLGDTKLILEADANNDGTYESMIGDDVPPGTKMRVRGDGLALGFVDVRANGATILNDAPLLPGQTIDFTAPNDTGWVRATLSIPDLQEERTLLCDPILGTLTTYCRNSMLPVALTSPIYLAD